jgi:hypothetical protein
MPDQPPTIDDNDHVIDGAWFSEHPDRTCYAREFRDGWTLLVKRVEPREPRRQRQSRVLIQVGRLREAPRRELPTVYLRTWAKLDTVPKTENACLLAWQRCSLSKAKTMNFPALTRLL